MIFELNKLFSDLRKTALHKNPEIIESIYQKYINLGCHYITTCNYGFKSLKLEDLGRVSRENYRLMFSNSNSK